MAVFLIVDDSKLIRIQVAGALRSREHEVLEAENSDEGIAIAKENAGRIDAIICDYNMPGQNGFDLIESLREDPAFKNTAILMLTTESNPDLKKRGKALGVIAWIIKPFNKDKFLIAMDQLVGSK